MMRPFFRIEAFIIGLSTFLGWFVVEFFLTTYLSESQNAIFIVPIMAAGLLVAAIWLRQRPQETAVTIEPTRLVTHADKRIHARKGIIVFVSLYRHQTTAVAMAERVAQAEAHDFERLDFENSNLVTIITTIDAHASKLEHCWLIGTQAETADTSSTTFIPALVAYLERKIGQQCRFHYGPEYALHIDKDDALIVNKTREMVNAIYQDARLLGVTEKEIVADFSGGYRSMSVGTLLACLNNQRDVQFAGTQYDQNGQPIGNIFPILLDFKTAVQEEN